MASAKRKAISPHNDDNEDYWNNSALKPFNFNEDDNDEDSIEVIGWDGSAPPSSKPKPPPSQSNSSTSTPAPSPPRAVTSARYKSGKKPAHFPPSPAALPTASASATESLPSHYKKERSIADVVSSQNVVNATDLAKLESENFSLRRQLEQAKRDTVAAPLHSETLTKMMVGNSYILELYKSKEEKAALLDGALKRFDGNAIIAITLFMRDTLKRDIFSKELMKRPVAVDHYCSYLREADEIDELHETLSALGRTEEAAILKYRQCLASTAASNPEIRASGLRDCIKYYFDSDLRLANDTNTIFEQISMMERQSVVESSDGSAAKGGTASIFKSHPRKESIVYKSVIDTLYYCCYYHWGEAESLYSSPTSIQQKHRIGEKQFLYTAISALCRMRRWRDLETILTSPKTMFRNARLHAVIGFDKVVDVLSKSLAPTDALSKYCAEIENTDKRLDLAIKNNCYKVAIDAFVTMRDRKKMLAYHDRIPVEHDYLRQHLMNQARSSDIKWKN